MPIYNTHILSVFFLEDFSSRFDRKEGCVSLMHKCMDSWLLIIKNPFQFMHSSDWDPIDRQDSITIPTEHRFL